MFDVETKTEKWGEPYEALPRRPIELDELHDRYAMTFDIYIPEAASTEYEPIITTDAKGDRSEFALISDDEVLLFQFGWDEEWRTFEVDPRHGSELASMLVNGRGENEGRFGLLL